MPNTGLVFEEMDPRGNVVSLSQSTFKEHINKQHPEVKAEEIESCIQEPDEIYQSGTFSDTHLYYQGQSTGAEPYVKVAVDFSQGGYAGRVKTAYKPNNISPSEKQIWKK